MNLSQKRHMLIISSRQNPRSWIFIRNRKLFRDYKKIQPPAKSTLRLFLLEVSQGYGMVAEIRLPKAMIAVRYFWCSAN
jgi:hypothetical protein